MVITRGLGEYPGVGLTQKASPAFLSQLLVQEHYVLLQEAGGEDCSDPGSGNHPECHGS